MGRGRSGSSMGKVNHCPRLHLGGFAKRACRLSVTTASKRSRDVRHVSSLLSLGAAASLVILAVAIVLPVVGGRPHSVAAAATDPVLVAAGDASCSPSDPNFNGSNSSVCQQQATADLIHRIGPNYLLAGGDTQYQANFTVGNQPTASEYANGYDATWGQL